jgi:hypothetical protein
MSLTTTNNNNTIINPNTLLSTFTSSGGLQSVIEILVKHHTIDKKKTKQPIPFGINRELLQQILLNNNEDETTRIHHQQQQITENQQALQQALQSITQLEQIEQTTSELQHTLEDDLQKIQPLMNRVKKLQDEINEMELDKQVIEILHSALTMSETLESISHVFRLLCKCNNINNAILSSSSSSSYNYILALSASRVIENIHKLRPILEKELSTNLKNMGWPVDTYASTNHKNVSTTSKSSESGAWARNIPQAKRTASITSFQNLLSIQLMAIRLTPFLSTTIEQQPVISQGDEIIQPLWAIECIAKPFVIRFQYHFCSNQHTNRIDRPEWFITFCLHSIRNHASFFEETSIQQTMSEILLDDDTSTTSTIKKLRFVDLNSHFIKCFVDQMYVRMKSHMPTLAQDDALLCHYMDEVIAGDRTLLGEFAYADAPHWPTLTSFFSTDRERFKAWIRADLKFARVRMNEILASSTAWNPLTATLLQSSSTYSAVVISTTIKNSLRDFATESSERVLNAVDSLSRRFDTLVSDKAKYEFVDQVQNVLLWDYANMVCSHHHHHQTSNQDTGDTSGGDSITLFIARVNSLQHVLDTLFEWSLQPKYIFAYNPGQQNNNDDDNDDNSRNSLDHVGTVVMRGVTTTLKSQLNMGKRMLRGLTAGGGNNTLTEEGSPSINNVSGGVFTRVITHIRRLLHDEILKEVDLLTVAVREVSYPLQNKTWISSLAQEDLSPEMCSCLSVIKEHVARWTRALHPGLRRRLASDSSRVLQDMFFHMCVLDSIAFSQSGAAQLGRDFSALFILYASFDKSPGLTFFPKLSESIRILNLNETELKLVIAQSTSSSVLNQQEIEMICRKRRDVFSDFY